MLLLLTLAACNEDNTPPPPAAPSWTALYSSGIGACDDFNFGELHYCVKQQSARTGQTISMSFSIGGTGTLYPVESADIAPATLRLFVSSDPSGTSMTRWWCPTVTSLPASGSYSATCTISAQWTGVYGQANTPPVGGINYVGYTMGGQYFAGHGVAARDGAVHFHLDNYRID